MVIELNEYCSDLILDRQMSILESNLFGDDSILSECFDIDLDLLSESVLLETTNIDMIKAFKSTISGVKNDIKAAKKCKDQSESKKHYADAISKLDELEKYLRGINDFKTGSKVLGNIASILLSLGIFAIMNIYNIVKTVKDHKNTKHIYTHMRDSIGIKDNKKDDGLSRVKLTRVQPNRTEVKRTTVFDNMSEKEKLRCFNSYNVLLKNLPAESAKAFGIRSIIPAVITLVKTSREIIQISKNGGTEKGFNMLRNKLIVYVRDMKTVLKLLCK